MNQKYMVLVMPMDIDSLEDELLTRGGTQLKLLDCFLSRGNELIGVDY